jgi:hypothetical protein
MHVQKPVLQVGQHQRRNRRVVAEHFSFGGAGLREQNPVEVADPEATTADVELALVRHARGVPDGPAPEPGYGVRSLTSCAAGRTSVNRATFTPA